MSNTYRAVTRERIDFPIGHLTLEMYSDGMGGCVYGLRFSDDLPLDIRREAGRIFGEHVDIAYAGKQLDI